MKDSTSTGSQTLGGYARNVTSQFGEDGILEEIFRRIGTRTKTCIEFGAWDGVHLSNTYHLWKHRGWQALLIEGNPVRCQELRDKTASEEDVTVVNAFVAPDGENSLESLIRRTAFQGTNADLVCIDIDGDDYHILASLRECHPRVLVVEYNPTIPPHIDLIQLPGRSLGSSALAIVRVAATKGYKLACMTDSNCIFVSSDEFSKLEIPEFDPIGSFPSKYLAYVVSDYSGNCYLTAQPVYAGKFPVLRFADAVRNWWRRIAVPRREAPRTISEPPLIAVTLFSPRDD